VRLMLRVNAARARVCVCMCAHTHVCVGGGGEQRHDCVLSSLHHVCASLHRVYLDACTGAHTRCHRTRIALCFAAAAGCTHMCVRRAGACTTNDLCAQRSQPRTDTHSCMPA
jgi:hypothetical protein